MVLQSNPLAAQTVVSALGGSFYSVRVVRTLDELRAGIIRHRAEVVVLDMEVASIKALQRLCREFPHVTMVCTHRLADEEIWTSALNAGAADVCAPSDTTAILQAALRSSAALRKAAA